MQSHALAFYETTWREAERVVSDMEARGLALNPAACEQHSAVLEQEMAQLEQELAAWVGESTVLWSSPKQVAEYLYDCRGFPIPPVHGTLKAVKITRDGERPTSEAALAYLANSVKPDDAVYLRKLMRWKKAQKERGYHDKLPGFAVNGRVHSQIGPNTETGRLSAKNPEMQAMHPNTRDAIVAPDGKLLVCLDYSGLEWRILAHILVHRYGDTSLVDDIQAGVDPHSATAKRMFGLDCDVADVKTLYPKQRAAAKILNYSINYGKTAPGLAVQLMMELDEQVTVEQAQGYLDAFYRVNPGIARFHRDIVDLAHQRGYVRSLLGRYRYLPEINAPQRWLRTKEERRAKNVIQNCAADIVTMAMIRTDAVADLVLQVHDELLFEVPRDRAAELREQLAYTMVHCLDGVRSFECPLDVEGGVGETWKEAGGK